MTESKAYEYAIFAVLDSGFIDNGQRLGILKILFRDLHYAEKREQDGKQ